MKGVEVVEYWTWNTAPHLLRELKEIFKHWTCETSGCWQRSACGSR